MTSFAYETMPPMTTSEEPGIAVRPAATRPPVQDSAVASVQPRRDSGRARFPRPSGRRSSRGTCRVAPRARTGARAAGPRRSDPPRDRRGSRSCGRRSSPRARPRRRLLPGRPALPATRRARRTSAVRRSGGLPRSSTRRTASVSSARGHSRCSSGGGPGSTMTGVPLASTTRPGAVPASPRTSAPSGTVACFVTPCAKSAYGRFIRSAAIRETPSI